VKDAARQPVMTEGEHSTRPLMPAASSTDMHTWNSREHKMGMTPLYIAPEHASILSARVTCGQICCKFLAYHMCADLLQVLVRTVRPAPPFSPG
jgi:hypothetical protein